MDSLRSLALDLGVPERTLRRAAGEGLVHGERPSPKKFHTTVREREYLRRYWPLLVRMRAVLRTEPNVALAVLYGSHAIGDAGPRSDVDLLVQLRDDDLRRMVDLSGRLSAALGRDVQTVRLADAQRTPALLADALAHGRVLVDRDRSWPALKRREARLRSEARREGTLEEAIATLELDAPTTAGRSR
jgi:predicted nucleotidyltransferase